MVIAYIAAMLCRDFEIKNRNTIRRNFIAEIVHKNNGTLIGNSGFYTMNEPEYCKIDYTLRIHKVPFS